MDPLPEMVSPPSGAGPLVAGLEQLHAAVGDATVAAMASEERPDGEEVV